MTWTPGQTKLLDKTPTVRGYCPGKHCRKPCGPGICTCRPCTLPCCAGRLERALRRGALPHREARPSIAAGGYQPRLFVPPSTPTKGAP